MARVLIAGCGDVGSLLGSSLHQAGHDVWGLKRDPTTLPPTIRGLQGDLSQRASLMNLPEQLDYVFYTAAAGGFNEARYQAAYLDGINNVLAVLVDQHQSLKRIFFTSSTSVYGQCQGEWVDEASPAEAASFAGRYLRQGEESLWQGPFPATVIRFGGIYGPGRTRLLDNLRFGAATCVETPPLYTNRIHRDDCAAALHHLLQLKEPRALYLAVDNQPAPQCEVLQWLARRLGVAGPTVVNAASVEETKLRANKRCRNDRLRESGFQFRYPTYREGYQTLLDN
jgi:nucleoside-diphosphate-sugar epimerase